MNSKAIKRQLLAAIAMVLVAALALGSSTYAWFVASGNVTATGMSVNVQSSGGLLIKYTGQGDGWGQSASAKMAETKLLKPASTLDMTKWSTATAAEAIAYGMNPDTITPVTVSPTATNIIDNEYVVKHTFHIRSTGNADGNTKGLYVKDVKVTAEQELNVSMRIGIVASYNSTPLRSFIMAPITVNESAPTNNYYVYEAKPLDAGGYEPNSMGQVSLVSKGTDAYILGSNVAVPGNGDSDYVVVSVFIWYEGQDEHLYSDNVHQDEKLDITLEFAANTTSSSSGGNVTTIPETVDLTNVSVSSTTATTADGTVYYEISGVTMNSKKLYTPDSTEITSDSEIYTITGGVAMRVTPHCILPAANGG